MSDKSTVDAFVLFVSTDSLWIYLELIIIQYTVQALYIAFYKLAVELSQVRFSVHNWMHLVSTALVIRITEAARQADEYYLVFPYSL